MSTAPRLRPAIRRGLALAASVALAGLVAGSTLAAGPAPSGARHAGASGKGGGKGPTLVIDHGGPVLASSKVYALFWGSFSGSELPGAMDQLLGGMNKSSYLGIVQQYMRGASIGTTYGGHLFDTSAPPKTAPKASALGAEVAKVYGTPVQDALYVVFTSNLPHISYCAWHDQTTANGVPIEVAYIPLQPAGCSPLGSVNFHANGYTEATQAAADSVAHEFIETVTDPKLNAWYDANGYEIADKCEYNYQAPVTLTNGSQWQIQSEWSNAIAACQQQ